MWILLASRLMRRVRRRAMSVCRVRRSRRSPRRSTSGVLVFASVAGEICYQYYTNERVCLARRSGRHRVDLRRSVCPVGPRGRTLPTSGSAGASLQSGPNHGDVGGQPARRDLHSVPPEDRGGILARRNDCLCGACVLSGAGRPPARRRGGALRRPPRRHQGTARGDARRRRRVGEVGRIRFPAIRDRRDRADRSARRFERERRSGWARGTALGSRKRSKPRANSRPSSSR